jgi:plastocyanin
MDTNAIIQDLKKSALVGYQTPSVPEGGSQVASNLSPLVPQQLSSTLAIATSSMADLKLWPMLHKQSAQNTIVEFNRVKSHGGEHSPFIGEGGLAALNRATYEKVAVQIRYLAERREITDQAMHVALNGPSPDALAEETTRGTEVLLRRVEKELFHADSSVNPLAWNGIISQINDGGNTSDLRGKAATPNYLQEVLGELYSAPRYGMASHILVTPRVLSELIKQSVTYGRHDQVQLNNGRLDYGSNQITISAPYGSVPVVACPFLEREDRVAPPLGSSSVFEGSMGASSIETAPDGQPAAAPSAASQFVAADEGAYIYRVVPVGAYGLGVAFDTDAVSVSAGDSVSFTIKQADGDATISHYRIYRSAPGAANGDGALFVGEVKLAGVNTTFVDNNERVAGGSEIVIINNRPDHMTYFQMMSLVRRPLAQVRASYPFMLMMFGAPAVLNPTKMWVVKNAGTNPAQGI